MANTDSSSYRQRLHNIGRPHYLHIIILFPLAAAAPPQSLNPSLITLQSKNAVGIEGLVTQAQKLTWKQFRV